MTSNSGRRTHTDAFVSDERAVSPVIGVVLVVAITVILASVVGTFALGLGESANEAAPTAFFETVYDESGPSLTVTFTHGDTVERNRLSWVVTGGDGAYTGGDFSGSGKLAPGDEATLDGIASTETVRLVWETAEGDRDATLLKWEAPGA